MQHDIHSGLERNQRDQQRGWRTQQGDQKSTGNDGDMQHDYAFVGGMHKLL